MSRVLIIFIISSFMFFFACKENITTNILEKPYTLKVLHNNIGYGYAIYGNGRLQIKQDFIPGIVGNQFFKTQDQAQKIGELVLSKISKGEDPAVFREDLIRAQIDFK
jgi:hypothetical protein